MNKQRLHYIDIIKGMCIILVVVRHAPFELSFAENPYMDIFFLKNFFIPFFMSAFFMVTGYCSNFNIPFKSFLWKNIKGILIPAFCLYYLNRWMENLDTFLYTKNPTWLTLQYWFSPGLRTFLSKGGYYWFLSSLFLAKMAIWPLIRLKPLTMQFCVAGGISFLGVYLANTIPLHNYFFLFNAMVLLPFLVMGFAVKQHGEIMLKMGGVCDSFFLIMCNHTQLFGTRCTLCWPNSRYKPCAVSVVHIDGDFRVLHDLATGSAYRELPIA